MSDSEDSDIHQVRKDDINKTVRKLIKQLPEKQRTFVLTHIRAICLGTIEKESGLLAIRGKFGVRAEVVARKILADALNPKVTSETMQPYI